MAKLLLLGAALYAFTAAGAFAQAVNAPPAPPDEQHSGLINGGHITSTGETVPHPGASQSAGTTSLDRGIEQEDTQIQNGICRGC
jgi:type 1 fimbria pilin